MRDVMTRLFVVAALLVASSSAKSGRSLQSWEDWDPSLNVASYPISAQNEGHYAAQMSALRARLLYHYDPKVPPSSSKAGSAGGDAAVNVGLQIRLYKLQKVDIAEAHLSMKVWWRMTWRDPRLSWTPSEYGNITEIPFIGASFASPEETEIWLPELTVYNSQVALAESLETTFAAAYPDGSVFWSRPGTLDLNCKFSGLVTFPRGDLTCQFEVGGWMLSGLTQRISLRNGGYDPLESASEETAGSSYQEYMIDNVTVRTFELFYDCCPGDPWPVAQYTVSVKRMSTSYYIQLVVIPVAILTILSFATFWMSYEVGERMGYGITLILANEVARATVMQLIPMCGETIWLDFYVFICTLFVCASRPTQTLSLCVSVLTVRLSRLAVLHVDDRVVRRPLSVVPHGGPPTARIPLRALHLSTAPLLPGTVQSAARARGKDKPRRRVSCWRHLQACTQIRAACLKHAGPAA